MRSRSAFTNLKSCSSDNDARCSNIGERGQDPFSPRQVPADPRDYVIIWRPVVWNVRRVMRQQIHAIGDER